MQEKVLEKDIAFNFHNIKPGKVTENVNYICV